MKYINDIKERLLSNNIRFKDVYDTYLEKCHLHILTDKEYDNINNVMNSLDYDFCDFLRTDDGILYRYTIKPLYIEGAEISELEKHIIISTKKPLDLSFALKYHLKFFAKNEVSPYYTYIFLKIECLKDTFGRIRSDNNDTIE